jgi:WD40 repeat protein
MQIQSLMPGFARSAILAGQSDWTRHRGGLRNRTNSEKITLSGMRRAITRFSPDRSTWAAMNLQTLDYRMGSTAESSEAARLTGHRDGIFCLEFSPIENIVATGSIDNTARLWDWPSGRQLAILAGHKEGVFNCDFSPDGRTLATASGDKTVKLWHVSTRREVLTLEHERPATVCVFSPEGNYLVTGTVDGVYHFWRAGNWKEIGAIEANERREDPAP